MKSKKMILTIGMAISIATMMGFSGCSSDKDSDRSSSKKGESITTTSSSEAADDTTSSDYKKGSLTSTSFESSFLNLKFTAPEGYTMATEAEMIEMSGLGAEVAGIDAETYNYALANTVYEMMVTSPLGTPNIIVMAEKLAMENMTAETYCVAIASGLLVVEGIDYTIGETKKNVMFAGQEYTQLSASGTVGEIVFLQDYYVRVNNDRIVAIIVSYTDDTTGEVATLMNNFTELN